MRENTYRTKHIGALAENEYVDNALRNFVAQHRLFFSFQDKTDVELRSFVLESRRSLVIADSDSMRTRTVRLIAGSTIHKCWRNFHTRRRFGSAVNIQRVFRGFTVRETFNKERGIRFIEFIKSQISHKKARIKLLRELEGFGDELDEIAFDSIISSELALLLQETSCTADRKYDGNLALVDKIEPVVQEQIDLDLKESLIRGDSEAWSHQQYRGKRRTQRRIRLHQKGDQWR
jgi:hypothetical protein